MAKILRVTITAGFSDGKINATIHGGPSHTDCCALNFIVSQRVSSKGGWESFPLGLDTVGALCFVLVSVGPLTNSSRSKRLVRVQRVSLNIHKRIGATGGV